MAAAVSPTVAAFALTAIAFSTGILNLLPFAAYLSVIGALTTLYAWQRNPEAREIEGPVRADAGGVSFAGAPLLDRHAIRDGFVLPREGRLPLVRLTRRAPHSPLDLRVRDEEEGRRLLRALGLDASQTVASFQLPSRALMSRRWRGGLFGGAGLFAAIVPLFGRLFAPETPEVWLILMMLPLTAALMFSVFSKTRLQVGADGLLVTWLGARRFISYGEVRGVTRWEDPGRGKNRWTGVHVWLGSGERVRITIAAKQAFSGPTVEIVEERIREAMDTHRRGDAAGDAALLRRRGLEVSDWIRALRHLGTGASAAHRTAPVLPERLWRVVEDPSAEPSARAGAAVAVAIEADDEGRARLRAAARATAAPRLRVAIEAAAGGREDELAQVLAEIEDEQEDAGAPMKAAREPRSRAMGA